MLQPVLDRVLVKRIEDEGGSAIITPDIAKQKSNKGKVVAAAQFFQFGGHYFNISDFVQVGDTVLFGEFTNQPVTIDGEELLIVRIHDILGVEKACGVPEKSKESNVLKSTASV